MTSGERVPGEPVRINLTASQWALLAAAIKSAEVAGARIGPRDVYAERMAAGASPFAEIAWKVEHLAPVAGRYSLVVDDAEFAVLLVAAERAIFHGPPWDRVVLDGTIVDIGTEVPRGQLSELTGRLFRHLMAVPHRPTVRLDGGLVV